MAKLKWQDYHERLEKSGLKQAEIARQTGISYPRLVGFFNGSWDLKPEDLAKVDAVLSASNEETGKV